MSYIILKILRLSDFKSIYNWNLESTVYLMLFFFVEGGTGEFREMSPEQGQEWTSDNLGIIQSDTESRI